MLSTKAYTVDAAERQVHRLVGARMLEAVPQWVINTTTLNIAKRAMAKIEDPRLLEDYWKVICLMRGHVLSGNSIELDMCVSLAVTQVLGECLIDATG